MEGVIVAVTLREKTSSKSIPCISNEAITRKDFKLASFYCYFVLY